jgi:hypothetical protein
MTLNPSTAKPSTSLSQAAVTASGVTGKLAMSILSYQSSKVWYQSSNQLIMLQNKARVSA